jgi:hypothetical protein
MVGIEKWRFSGIQIVIDPKQKRLMDTQTCNSQFMRIGQIIRHHIKCLESTYKLLASHPHRRSKVRVLFRPHMNPKEQGVLSFKPGGMVPASKSLGYRQVTYQFIYAW